LVAVFLVIRTLLGEVPFPSRRPPRIRNDTVVGINNRTEKGR
jgi:hypothetical protein